MRVHQSFSHIRLTSPLLQLWFHWSDIRRQCQHWSNQCHWDPLTPLLGSVLLWDNILIHNIENGTIHMMSFTIPLTRCKQINLRRLLCDWTQYEDDITTLQDIVQQQVSHSEGFLQSGQLPCHSPGNLLHFPLTLEQVSRYVNPNNTNWWQCVCFTKGPSCV